MERLGDEPIELETEQQPSFFLSHDTLMLLEEEVWSDYQTRIDAGSITPDQATQLFMRWRAGYITSH
jgi:hypothetical protein